MRGTPINGRISGVCRMMLEVSLKRLKIKAISAHVIRMPSRVITSHMHHLEQSELFLTTVKSFLRKNEAL